MMRQDGEQGEILGWLDCMVGCCFAEGEGGSVEM